MPDLHYTHPRLAALYDAERGPAPDHDFYLALPGVAPERILDLGCGTGRLCALFAQRGHRATGVDPAAAMLDVARARPGGDGVAWVQATAQGFRSPDRFDLVVMTGHALQVLPTPADLGAAFATMAAHLAPGGRAVFETRNPALDWRADWDGHQERLTAEGAPVVLTYACGPMTDGRLRFETRYAFPDETLVSRSELWFPSLGGMEDGLAAAGLRLERLQGDWDGSPFAPDRSPEMIVTSRLA